MIWGDTSKANEGRYRFQRHLWREMNRLPQRKIRRPKIRPYGDTPANAHVENPDEDVLN